MLPILLFQATLIWIEGWMKTLHRLGSQKKGETRHADFFDGILNLGFHDCLRKFHSLPIQTYRHNRGTYPWELDHMFATPELYNRLKSINVYVDENILSLSDHNPIVAEFED